MAGRQASMMANRSTRSTKRRADAPVSRDAFRQSLAENHSGTMMFDNEFMGGAAAKRSRSRALDSERNKPVALRQLTHPIHAVSTESDLDRASGAEFTVTTDRVPLHVPQSATNVYASLTGASVPYEWYNVEQDGLLVAEATVPTPVESSEETSVDIPVRIRLPSTAYTSPFRLGRTLPRHPGHRPSSMGLILSIRPQATSLPSL